MFMKKTLAILSAMLVLVACGNDKLSVDTPEQELQETGGFKVDLTINTAATKAYVKSSFATNDVVFIFFDGIASPKYLEAKRTNSDTWEYTAKNGLTAADLEGAATKKMTAVYLPYGSSSTVVAGEGGVFGFTPTYEGYFLKDEKSSYTISSSTLSGSLTLGAPALTSGEVYIHFDVQGFTASNDYSMYQNSVRPLALAQVSSDGTITLSEGTAGKAMKGYEDGSNLTFSGALAASAVGSAKDYQFSILDKTGLMLYKYNAGSKTISESKYIGLGDISSKWNSELCISGFIYDYEDGGDPFLGL
jgi:hypothetical protein